jgi:hypothetical protein
MIPKNKEFNFNSKRRKITLPTLVDEILQFDDYLQSSNQKNIKKHEFIIANAQPA